MSVEPHTLEDSAREQRRETLTRAERDLRRAAQACASADAELAAADAALALHGEAATLWRRLDALAESVRLAADVS